MDEQKNFILCIVVIAYICKGITWLIDNIKQDKLIQNKIYCKSGIALALVFTVALFPLWKPVKDRFDEGRNVDAQNYMESLGGSTTKKVDLEKIMQIIGEEKFFSTYASGLEVLGGTFQPTGYDYIIHTMGDAMRARYVSDFLAGEYKYVTNPVMTLNPYTGWIRQANWFFFKEVYAHYNLAGEIGYLEYWEIAQDDNYLDIPVKIELFPTVNGGYRIVCTADSNINAVTDVLLSYNIESNGTKGGMFRTLCAVSDPTFGSLFPNVPPNYNLPGSANELSVPVTLINGRGEITLTPYPLGYSTITGMKATVNAVIEEPYTKYMSGNGLQTCNLTDNNWDSGVARYLGNILLFSKNSKTNETLLINKPNTISVGDISARITKIEDKGNYIWVTIEDSADTGVFAYPAHCTVSR